MRARDRRRAARARHAAPAVGTGEARRRSDSRRSASEADRRRPARRRARASRAPPRRALAGGVRRADQSRLERPVRLRHGRLGDRRRAGRGGARRSPGRPMWACAATGCRLDARPTAPSSAPATRATPRRPSPATRPRRRSARNAIVATTGGALAEAARRDGVPVIGWPAGLQPRAAVGYMSPSPPRSRRWCGAAPRIRTEIDAAAAHLEAGRRSRVERAGELAAAIERLGPADLRRRPHRCRSRTAGRRRSTRTPKCPRSPTSCPSSTTTRSSAGKGLDPTAADAPRLSAIFLGDRDSHPSASTHRIELTAKLIEPHAAGVHLVETEGETRTARLLHAVVLGDLLSL